MREKINETKSTVYDFDKSLLIYCLVLLSSSIKLPFAFLVVKLRAITNLWFE